MGNPAGSLSWSVSDVMWSINICGGCREPGTSRGPQLLLQGPPVPLGAPSLCPAVSMLVPSSRPAPPDVSVKLKLIEHVKHSSDL